MTEYVTTRLEKETPEKDKCDVGVGVGTFSSILNKSEWRDISLVSKTQPPDTSHLSQRGDWDC